MLLEWRVMCAIYRVLIGRGCDAQNFRPTCLNIESFVNVFKDCFDTFMIVSKFRVVM